LDEDEYSLNCFVDTLVNTRKFLAENLPLES